MASQITLWERLSLLPKLLPLPVVLAYTALISPFARKYRKKQFHRILHERATRYLIDYATVPQLQWVGGTTSEAYKTWAKGAKIEPVIEETQEGVKLMWIGSKDAEHVIFYIHGGGYMIAAGDYALKFWTYVKEDIQKRKQKEISIVLVEYPLWPQTFPTQLTAVVHGLGHILKDGRVKPSNLQLAGDSAGANLTLQLIGHTLHPVPDVPPSPLSTTSVLGTCLISPWLSLDKAIPSHTENDPTDFLSKETVLRWGRLYTAEIPESQLQYVKVNLAAPQKWFEGIDRVVERVLITVGDAETLKDDSITLHERLSGVAVGSKPDLKLDIQIDGVHDESMMAVGAGLKGLNEAGERISEWLIEGWGF